MKQFTTHRTLIYTFCLLLTGIGGCSVFGKNPAADTQAATEKTAYYVCSGCHGPANVRVDFMPPNIIGQKKRYLETALRDYRDKKRIAPLMNGISENLSDQDIDNLAAYYSNILPDKK